MSEVRIGLIGIGSFSTNYHVRNLLNCPDARITALCDRSQEQLAVTQQKFGGSQTFTDHRALLDADLVDGIVISTPNQYHFAQCKDALERDIPVLVDKPITVTVEDAETLVELSKSRDVILMTAFTRHFMGSTELVRREVRTDLEIQHLAAVQRQSRIKNTIADGGMLHRRTVHIFDVIPWFTGQTIVSVSSTIEYEHDHTEERLVDARLTLEDGLICDLLCIKDCDENQDEVSVYGRNQSYRLHRAGLERMHDRNWETVDVLPDVGNSTTHFIEAIQGKPFAPDAPYADCHSEDGLQSIRILEAVHRSTQTMDPTDLSEA